MAEENPEHRTAVTPRSGDTHVIGEDGTAVNIDQAARDAAAAEAALAPVLGEDGAPLNPPAGDPTDPPAELKVPRRGLPPLSK